MNRACRHSILVLCGLAFLSGCADDPYQKTKIGAALGGLIGAGTGAAIDSKNRGRGAAIGAAVGVLAGGGVGLYMDKQKKAIEEQLSKELANHDVELRKLPDNSIKVDLKSEASFASGNSDVKPSFSDALAKLGGVVKQYDSTMVHVIGHTDSQGSDNFNQQLSERRATAVANSLTSAGVDPSRVRSEGRGEAQPEASNVTAEGRSQNRRVEIYLKPVVEGKEQEALQTPK
ncbi:MAG TPA: OmpA family protein [Nitrospira sp.]|nr:OmpA family protein [Nitrospira sp.]